MIQNDTFIKEINDLINMCLGVFFSGKIYKDNENSKNNKIYRELQNFISDGKINDGENFYYDNIDLNDTEYLQIGLSFYRALNDLDDKFLHENDFSRKEIKIGIEDLLDAYNINFIGEKWADF